MIISMIVAIADNGCIGKDNSLPWPHIPEDMKWFREHTMGKVVLMGSKTWRSLPDAVKPLKGRENVVMTNKALRELYDSDLSVEAHYHVSGSPEEIVEKLKKRYPDHQEVVIMGGAEVYRQFRGLAERLYVTRIGKDFDGDCFLNLDLAENEFEVVKGYTTVGEEFSITYEILERKQ